MSRYRHHGSSRAGQTSAGIGRRSSHTSAEITAAMKVESVLNAVDSSAYSPNRHTVPPHVESGTNVPYRPSPYNNLPPHCFGAYTSPPPPPPPPPGFTSGGPRGPIRGNSVTKTPTRAARPPYEDEEVYFIWYYRTDLRQPWETVIRAFALQFPARERSRGGLQCKFYRALARYGVEKVREQTRQRSRMATRDENLVGRYGVIQRTIARFHWMEPHHQKEDVLPEFRDDCLRDLRDLGSRSP